MKDSGKLKNKEKYGVSPHYGINGDWELMGTDPIFPLTPFIPEQQQLEQLHEK